MEYGEDAFDDVEQILRTKFGVVPEDGDTAQGPPNEDILSSTFVLPSVGIESMDHEHDKCETALAALMDKPTVQLLTDAVTELTTHFQHEKKLIKSNGFGNPGQPFSSFDSHLKDHERILSSMGAHARPQCVGPRGTTECMY